MAKRTETQCDKLVNQNALSKLVQRLLKMLSVVREISDTTMRTHLKCNSSNLVVELLETN